MIDFLSKFIDFLSKFIVSFGLASAFSFTISIFLLLFLSFAVNLFRLNYYGNTYWVLSFTLYVSLFIWIFSYAYFITRSEELGRTEKVVKSPKPVEYISSTAGSKVGSLD